MFGRYKQASANSNTFVKEVAVLLEFIIQVEIKQDSEKESGAGLKIPFTALVTLYHNQVSSVSESLWLLTISISA
jgi:hypothetical protein